MGSCFLSRYIRVLRFALPGVIIIIMSLSMLNQSVASMARVPGGKYHNIKEKLWGIELSKEKPESTWKPELPEEEVNQQRHNLCVQRCLLGKDAKSKERNVVEVVTKDMDGDDISSPIFSLTLGKCDQSSLGLTFGHPDADDDRLDPVTFRLVAGSGPVHLIGFQMSEAITDVDPDDTDMDEEDEEEDEDEEELEPAPKKGGKKK